MQAGFRTGSVGQKRGLWWVAAFILAGLAGAVSATNYSLWINGATATVRPVITPTSPIGAHRARLLE
jgi:hypothetical protein